MRSFGERNRIENLRALVAKDGERAADRAGRFIVAVAAWSVEIDARAGDERNRTFHRPDDFAERDLPGRAGEPVAALWPARAFHEPGLLEVEHDELEIFGGNPLRFGDPRQLHRRAALLLGEEKE